jgi:hypothetical protein
MQYLNVLIEALIVGGGGTDVRGCRHSWARASRGQKKRSMSFSQGTLICNGPSLLDGMCITFFS